MVTPLEQKEDGPLLPNTILPGSLRHVLFLPQFWPLITLMRITEGLVPESTAVYDYNG